MKETQAQRFYVRMAMACLAIAVLGFAPTYWVPMLRGTLHVPPIIHLHALLFYSWTLLFLKQTMLAGSGNLARHRELGVAGVAIATAMVFVGLAAAMNSIRHQEAAGFGPAARVFSIVPVSVVGLFAVLFAIAIVYVKKPEVHKRVLLVATVSLLQAAVGRWFLLFFAPPRPAGATGLPSPPPVFVTLPPSLLLDLLLVVAMIHDRRTRGRVHPAYWFAGGAVVAVQVLRVPVSATGAWAQVVGWLVAF
jgi:hypothetical protein